MWDLPGEDFNYSREEIVSYWYAFAGKILFSSDYWVGQRPILLGHDPTLQDSWATKSLHKKKQEDQNRAQQSPPRLADSKGAKRQQRSLVCLGDFGTPMSLCMDFTVFLSHPAAEEDAAALLLRTKKKKLGPEVHNFSISHSRKIRGRRR